MKFCLPVPLSVIALDDPAAMIRLRIGRFFQQKGVAEQLADERDPLSGDFDVVLVPIEGKDKVTNPMDLARAEVFLDDGPPWPIHLFVLSHQVMGWKPPKDDPDFPDMDQPTHSVFLEFMAAAELGNLLDIKEVDPISPESVRKIMEAQGMEVED